MTRDFNKYTHFWVLSWKSFHFASNRYRNFIKSRERVFWKNWYISISSQKLRLFHPLQLRRSSCIVIIAIAIISIVSIYYMTIVSLFFIRRPERTNAWKREIRNFGGNSSIIADFLKRRNSNSRHFSCPPFSSAHGFFFGSSVFFILKKRVCIRKKMCINKFQLAKKDDITREEKNGRYRFHSNRK